MRKVRADLLRWLAVAGTLFGAAAGLGMALTGVPVSRVGQHVPELATLAAACAGFGWFLQAILAECGVSLYGRPLSDQATDYDDEPPAG
jgi:hypothetical protein